MHRSFVVILAAIILIPAAAMTAAAQGRGHFGGGGFVRGGTVARGAFGFGGARHFGGPVGPFPSRGPVAPFGSPIGRPFRPFGFGRFPRPIIVPPAFGFSPFISAVPIFDVPIFSTYPEPVYSEPEYAAPAVPAPAVGQSEVDLAYQVGRLSEQVEQLQQQIQQPPAQQPPAQQPPAQQPPGQQPPGQTQATPQRTTVLTVLLFQDGRRLEVQNYAIVGQTLWVLDERVATKIPISDLDLDATQRENRSRGIQFLVPGK